MIAATNRRLKPRAWRRVLAAVTAIGLLLSACSKHSAPDSKAATGSASQVGKTVQTVTTVGTARGALPSLTWALPYGEPNTIDPPNTGYYSSAMVAMNLCDSLLRLNPDLSVAPNLATYQQPDDRTLILNVKSGVQFWDGTPLTAADVVWSLKHAAAPTTITSFLFGSVTSIRATGPLQVTLRLKTPDALLVTELASFAGAVQEAKFSATAGKKLGSAQGKVMCTGPYELASWNPGDSMRLSANPDYWDASRRARAKSVTIRFVSDSTALAQSLVNGEIDGAYEVPAATIPRLQSASSGKLYYGAPSNLYLTLSSVRSTGPLADPKVRRAFYMSIDTSGLAQVVYHASAEPNYTTVNVDSWKNAATPAAAQQVWSAAYDKIAAERRSWGSATAQQQARTLAKQAGYHGQPIVLATLAGDATLSQAAQVIQADAQKAGFTVQIKPLQSIEFSNATSDAKARAGLDLLIAVSFNVAPNPLEQVGFDYGAGSFYNYTNYHDKTVDADVAKARTTTDPVEQARLLTQAQAIYEQNLSSMTILQLDEIMFLKNGLGGATASFAYLNEPSLALIGKA